MSTSKRILLNLHYGRHIFSIDKQTNGSLSTIIFIAVISATNSNWILPCLRDNLKQIPLLEVNILQNAYRIYYLLSLTAVSPWNSSLLCYIYRDGIKRYYYSTCLRMHMTPLNARRTWQRYRKRWFQAYTLLRSIIRVSSGNSLWSVSDND